MTEHYYLVISDEGRSTIQRKEAPVEAARYAYPLNKESYGRQWHIFPGRADHHYLAYEFKFNGPVTGRTAHVIDLGPVDAYEEPGLPEERMTKGPGKLRPPWKSPCHVDAIPENSADDPCARCSMEDGYNALIEHHRRHHETGE